MCIRDRDYVLLLEGKEIARYASVKEFVDEHAELLEKLQKAQDELLESYYRLPS